MKEKKIAILGGDRRMLYAARALKNAGYPVISFGLAENAEGIPSAQTLAEAVKDADIVLLPIPMSRDGKTLSAPALTTPLFVSDIFEKVKSDAVLFGGMTDAFQDDRLFDYGARPDFALKGAIPTAEGALLLALGELSCTVNGISAAVVGFGRVGKATAALFRSAGAKVTVFARRDEVCTVASHLGYEAAPLAELSEYAGDFRLVMNTVPAPVIGDAVLCRMRGDALILELASAPYGVDFAIAKERNIRTIRAGGLPGKYAPETAGQSIVETVLAMLDDMRI